MDVCLVGYSREFPDPSTSRSLVILWPDIPGVSLYVLAGYTKIWHFVLSILLAIYWWHVRARGNTTVSKLRSHESHVGMAHSCNPSPEDAKAGWTWVPNQAGPHTVRPCFKTNKKQNQKLKKKKTTNNKKLKVNVTDFQLWKKGKTTPQPQSLSHSAIEQMFGCLLCGGQCAKLERPNFSQRPVPTYSLDKEMDQIRNYVVNLPQIFWEFSPGSHTYENSVSQCATRGTLKIEL